MLPIHKSVTRLVLPAPAPLISYPLRACYPCPPSAETLPPASTLFSAWAVRLITSDATQSARCARGSGERGALSSSFRRACRMKYGHAGRSSSRPWPRRQSCPTERPRPEAALHLRVEGRVLTLWTYRGGNFCKFEMVAPRGFGIQTWYRGA